MEGLKNWRSKTAVRTWPVLGRGLPSGRSIAIPGQTGPEGAGAGQKAAFKLAWETTVLIRLSAGDSRVEVLAARPRADAMVRVDSLRRPRVWRKGWKRGCGNGIIPL